MVRIFGVTVIAAAIVAAGAIGAFTSARSASAAPPVRKDGVATLTKRLARLEQEVRVLQRTAQEFTALQRTMERICATGQLVSSVAVNTPGQVNVQYVHCSW